MKKAIALLLTLIMLLIAATGCLPQIMREILGPNGKEKPENPMETQAVQETPAQGVLPPASTPETISPSAAQPVPADALEAVYSRLDYVRVYPDYPQEFDLDGDGALETLNILENSGAPDSEMIGITVGKNGQTYAAEVVRAYLKDAFVAYNAEGKPCIVLSYDYASDDYETVIYTFDGQSLTNTDSVTGFVEGVYEGVWMLRAWVYTLGTWNGYHKYALSSSFAFESVGPDLWMLQDAGPNRVLTAKAGLQAQFFENGALAPGEIRSGERLRPYATDQREVICFRMEDGRTGTLPMEFRDGYTYINGQQDETAFDAVMYAG